MPPVPSWNLSCAGTRNPLPHPFPAVTMFGLVRRSNDTGDVAERLFIYSHESTLTCQFCNNFSEANLHDVSRRIYPVPQHVRTLWRFPSRGGDPSCTQSVGRWSIALRHLHKVNCLPTSRKPGPMAGVRLWKTITSAPLLHPVSTTSSFNFRAKADAPAFALHLFWNVLGLLSILGRS